MAVPLTPPPTSNGVAADQANFVVQGRITAVGPTLPAPMYGAFNVLIWGSANTTLTTTVGSSAATVASATGLAAGQTIVGNNVPPGTTIGAISGTNVTQAFPPGSTNAAVATGADATAVFEPVTVAATLQLERTFDGGTTWLVCGVGGSGAQAVWVNPSCISVVGGEPEKQVGYRLNCTAYTSGTINYRLSATGHMAISAGALTV